MQTACAARITGSFRLSSFVSRHSSLVIRLSSFVIRLSSLVIRNYNSFFSLIIRNS